MFTPLQNTILNSLRSEPKVKDEFVEEIVENSDFTPRGVASTITRIEKANLIKNNEGILTLTQDGLKSIETQVVENDMSGRLARGRRL